MKAKKSNLRARSKQFFENSGYAVTPVEQAVKFPDVRKRPCQACKRPFLITILKDAFGFADLLICGHGMIALVQVTDTGDMQKRVRKITAEPDAQRWLENRGRIIVHGWAKEGPAGRRKLWTLTAQEVVLEASGELAECLSPASGDDSSESLTADKPEPHESFPGLS